MRLKLFPFVFLAAFLSTSCVRSENYELISEMNSLHTIEIVYIDEATMNEIGEFPIDRSYYAQLISEIQKQGPAAVVLKFFFDQPSPNDDVLASELAKYDNIITQISVSSTSDAVPASQIENVERVAIFAATDSRYTFDSVELPTEILLNHFSGFGIVIVEVDDHRYVDYPLYATVDKYTVPSIALETVALITGSEPHNNAEIIADGINTVLKNIELCSVYSPTLK